MFHDLKIHFKLCITYSHTQFYVGLCKKNFKFRHLKFLNCLTCFACLDYILLLTYCYQDNKTTRQAKMHVSAAEKNFVHVRKKFLSPTWLFLTKNVKSIEYKLNIVYILYKILMHL